MMYALEDDQSKNTGPNTNVCQYIAILTNSVIGSNYNICSHCPIESDVTIDSCMAIKFCIKGYSK